jgi:hypothetical protein
MGTILILHKDMADISTTVIILIIIILNTLLLGPGLLSLGIFCCHYCSHCRNRFHQ